MEHYPRLVRLAYLTLPPALGRHRRVLAAHATVQRVLPVVRPVGAGLPGTRARPPAGRGPAARPATAGSAGPTGSAGDSAAYGSAGAPRYPSGSGYPGESGSAGSAGYSAAYGHTGPSGLDQTAGYPAASGPGDGFGAYGHAGSSGFDGVSDASRADGAAEIPGTGRAPGGFGARGPGAAAAEPPAREVAASAGYRWVRYRVLRGALRGRRGLPAGPLPRVAGLRLFPSAGGADELALDQALSSVPAPARAAFALGVLEGLPDAEVTALLSACGTEEPEAALRIAGRLRETGGGRVESLLRTAEFDPCVVQTRPTDLLRRRSRFRAAAVAALCVLLVAGSAISGDPGPDGTATAVDGKGWAASRARAVDPVRLERAPRDAWADTSRVDFSAWPARGGRTADTELLRRALGAWASPGAGVRVSATPDTPRTPPALPPRLLYAGEADGAAVVLLHEGGRVVRYAEPLSGRGAAALDLARVDDADVTTGAAVVVSRTATGARLLLAPWIAGAAVRDLLAPDRGARPLAVAADGVTPLLAAPAGAGTACTAWPAVQLRSSARIVEDHAFLVTDLGDLVPAHLTHTPAPGSGAPARQPREATGGPALANWARAACLLPGLRGAGVRTVNDWTFAEQGLPDGGGRAVWVCTRAETWRGPGRVLVRFQPPDPGGAADGGPGPGRVVAEARDTAACGRFGQHVLAGTRWRSPEGRWYLLAAGSRRVTRITAAGAVTATAPGPTLAAPAPDGAGEPGSVRLSALLSTGDTLTPLGRD